MAMEKEFTKLLIDTAKGVNAENYTKAQSQEAINKHFASILGISEKPTRKEVRRALRKHKLDVFEAIEDTVEELRASGWGENPFFNAYVEQRNIDNGDVNDFYVEDDSLLTVSKFAGNHHDLLRQKMSAGQHFSVPTEWYGLKIYNDFELMMIGQIDWAKLVQKIYASWDNFVNSLVYNAVMDASKTIPSGFKKTGSLTLDGVEELATEIGAQANTDVVICGTRAALVKLYKKLDPAWIPASSKEERTSTGRVSFINGIQTMELPQVYEAGTRKPLMDNNKLIFLPVHPDFKPFKLVNEGDAYIHEVSDRETNVDMTIEAEYMQKLGVGVVMNLDYGEWNSINA